jgi:hypothetical protein
MPQGMPFQPGMPPGQQQQPAMVQTPFGPIPNPNVRNQQQQQGVPGIVAQPGVINPGQNTLFPNSPGAQQPQQQQQQQPMPIIPGLPGAPNSPFGTFSGFGTPNPSPAVPNNNVFGNPPGSQR